MIRSRTYARLNNGDGALSVWGRITGERNDMHVTDATQWFQSNGELWGVNSNCFDERSGGPCFAYRLPFTPLDEFLRKGVAVIRAMGGTGPIGIKLGAGDLTDTVLPSQFPPQGFPAVTARASVEDELETWTPAERRAILLRFWNALMDAYGQPPARSVAEFEKAAAIAPLPE